MHYSQSPGSHHSRQNSAAGEQLHTLSGSPITPTSTSLDATPHHTYNNTHGKFKTSTPSVVTADYTKAKLFRRRVMRQVTVPRLQILWGLLALFGTMAWLSMMPAYAFRWIVLAADKQGGAKANCREGPLADQSGYTAQCRGVNVAIVLDVIVFLLWLPIGAVIVCGTIERGFWWWRADGWAIHQKNQQNTAITTKTITPKKGDKTMSEEEFDLKIGVNSNKNRSHGGGLGGSQDRLSYYADEEEEAMESRPAFVTPIASKFRTSTTDDESRGQDTEHHHIGQVAPSGYRQHHQQHQQQQRQQSQDQIQVIPRSGGVGGRGGRLVRKGSNNSMTPSISARLSAFFGQGWNSGPMPPPPPSEPAQPAPPVPAHHRPLRFEPSSSKDADRESQADKGSAHGDAYTTQWHNRRYDEWS
ncbi:hypothetical protein FBU30_008997 [Linnemannia zychae]|nr:hypothetical protein FBU30_008997 [Linnemannia zychae]